MTHAANFEFEPTAHEMVRRKKAAMSLKQKQAQARRKLKRITASYDALARKNPPASNYLQLLHLREYCREEQIEEPLWMRFEILLHEAAMVQP